jgi:hypothetical protein
LHRPAKEKSMRMRTAAAGGTLVVTGLLGLSAAPALAVCDAYSGTCTEPPRVVSTTLVPQQPNTPETEVLSRATTADATTPSTLPFTGGELVLISVVGSAAVAGGAALVLAGRRRRATS